jgi:hypothetical protein
VTAIGQGSKVAICQLREAKVQKRVFWSAGLAVMLLSATMGSAQQGSRETLVLSI